MREPAAFERLRRRLRLPLIAAPMFLVSGVELVVAACRSGVIGAFPTANCRSTEGYPAKISGCQSFNCRTMDSSGSAASSRRAGSKRLESDVVTRAE